MIKLRNGYCIKADDLQYILGKMSKDKDGNDVFRAEKYCTTLSGIIEIAIMKDARNAFCTDVKEMRKVILEYREILKELKETLTITL